MENYVTVSDLKKATMMLLQLLDSLGVTKINLTNDYYWSISKEEKYAIDRPPSDMTLGQLTDDLLDIQKIIKKEYEPVIHNFLDLAAIFSHIGERGEANLIKQR